MNPRALKKWLILAAIVYFVFPYDLIPDFAGLPGRIDDVMMMVGLAWFYRNYARQFFASAAGSGQNAGRESAAGLDEANAKAFDPYAVLGVPPSASRDAIHSAYRSRMQEYHPDKVAHLGEELQKLAHEKSQQIQRAYQELGS
jgi:hypothetical protein